MVADCRLGGLITPLFDRSPAKAIEVFTAIRVISVDGGGALEAGGPVDRLAVVLDGSSFWVEGLCVSIVEVCTTATGWLAI